MKEFTVRVLGSEDHSIAVDLLSRQFGEHRIDLSTVRLAAAVDALLADPARGLMLGACTVDDVVGVACLAFHWTLEHGGRAAWLEELYVRPEFRDRGVGRALLDSACEHAARVGCHAVDLEVDIEHTRAEHLYLRRGFVPLARRRFVLRLEPVPIGP